MTLASPTQAATRPAAPHDALRRTAIGLSLAAAVLGAWVSLHVFGVFLYRPEREGWAWAPAIILVQAWLGVGLFIVAHDAMHGSLAPGRAGWNGAVGRIAAALYNPGFAYGKLHGNHHAHHRHSGAEGDPDFHPERPTAYVRWFLRFFRTYFGWWEFARLTVVLCVYLFVFHVRPLNFFAFWAAPALLSALQLFTFGTWLPHRHEARAFRDRHNARSLEFGWLPSLLACFHFGYHLEHHHSPGTPWWALPRYRATQRRLAQAASGGG